MEMISVGRSSGKLATAVLGLGVLRVNRRKQAFINLRKSPLAFAA
jgi:hypothetical protein